MPQTFMLPDALKAQQWERAKGELRALVALQGSYSSRDVGDDSEQKWERLQKAVEAFVADVEDNALQE